MRACVHLRVGVCLLPADFVGDVVVQHLRPSLRSQRCVLQGMCVCVCARRGACQLPPWPHPCRRACMRKLHVCECVRLRHLLAIFTFNARLGATDSVVYAHTQANELVAPGFTQTGFSCAVAGHGMLSEQAGHIVIQQAGARARPLAHGDGSDLPVPCSTTRYGHTLVYELAKKILSTYTRVLPEYTFLLTPTSCPLTS